MLFLNAVHRAWAVPPPRCHHGGSATIATEPNILTASKGYLMMMTSMTFIRSWLMRGLLPRKCPTSRTSSADACAVYRRRRVWRMRSYSSRRRSQTFSDSVISWSSFSTHTRRDVDISLAPAAVERLPRTTRLPPRRRRQ